MALCALGCASSTGTFIDAGDDAGPALADVGTDAGTDTGTDARFCPPSPSPPFGTGVGSTLGDLMVEECDGSPFRVHGEERCDFRATVLIQFAAWCAPCIEAAQDVGDILAEAFPAGDVRWLFLYTQTIDYEAPDRADCEAFRAGFGIEPPGKALLDPAQRSEAYNPDGTLPFFVVIDRAGRVHARGHGWSRDESAAVFDQFDLLDAINGIPAD